MLGVSIGNEGTFGHLHSELVMVAVHNFNTGPTKILPCKIFNLALFIFRAQV